MCDLKTLATAVKEDGCVLTGVKKAAKFSESAKLLSGSLAEIEIADIKSAFKHCILQLEEYIENNDVNSLDSKELMTYFFNNNSDHVDMKLVLHCLCVAAVKFSVESSVESLVSRYERHFDKGRQLHETDANHEMAISENGPMLHNADPVIKRSLNKYVRDHNKSGKGRWHFTATSTLAQLQKTSKTIKKQLAQKSKWPVFLYLGLITFVVLLCL